MWFLVVAPDSSYFYTYQCRLLRAAAARWPRDGRASSLEYD